MNARVAAMKREKDRRLERINARLRENELDSIAIHRLCAMIEAEEEADRRLAELDALPSDDEQAVLPIRREA